jgi:hypothetical protein
MDPQRIVIGLVTLGVFALAFLLLGERRGEAGEQPLWRWCRAGAVMLPFAFALHFAGAAELGEHLAPIAVLLLLLSICACWLTRRQPEPLLAPAAASATLGVVTVWFIAHDMSTALVWEAILVCAVLALVHAIACELEHGRETWPYSSAALLIATCGFLGLEVLAATSRRVPEVWPWLAGWAALAALLVRHARFKGREITFMLAGLGMAAGFFFFAAAHLGQEQTMPMSLLVGAMIATAIAFQAVATLWREAGGRRWAEHAAAATALAMLPAILMALLRYRPEQVLLLHISVTLLALLAALAATRLRAGAWYLVTVLAAAMTHTLLTTGMLLNSSDDRSLLSEILIVEALSVVLFVAWSTLAPRVFVGERSAWWGAALAGPLWFGSLKALYEARFGSETIGVLPILLALLTLAAVLRMRSYWSESVAVRKSALAWFLAVTLSFVSIAIPLQLENEWITIGWALNGLAVLALWSRLDHPGLKYFGLALLAAATVRLVLNPAVLEYYPRGPIPIINWVLYTYLVPAAALLASARILRRHEVARLRPRELKIYPAGRAVAAGTCGLAAVAVVFFWINLAIVDYFGTTTHLVLSFERMQARDVTTSIAWVIYGVILLVIGIRRDTVVLRWLSLVLIVVTILKLFLYDLGRLEGMYLVTAPFGIAVFLFLVSYLYQQFVLRKGKQEEES